MNAEQRILQERENWRKDRPFGFVAKPVMKKDKSLDLFMWECTIPGPELSPFNGCNLGLIIEFYTSYPASPPQVKFTSNIYHPNVYSDGFVCLDILSDAWTPSMNIKTILMAVHTLLGEPNNDSPANEEAAELYRKNPRKYMQKAIKCLSAPKQTRSKPAQ
ncbi:ubiquitin-conjugating enzyme E2 I [Nematocida minor]|uniref:ubiquitin-conjugating enzyme E2 I n=1 Tax=Nematocida minor TaxID=1912983 RepID=UPI00221FBB5D|nr:ubiquitin-conjugating enzyme E2 I [Nematocida minor]KAI5190815.1 ubiquitin-conjugating enzyme E2 I [Nematocida minor]